MCDHMSIKYVNTLLPFYSMNSVK
uniref:Uncharacterized protein n=1 Tax=Arundo donax TaxID=35708 RepID=A0A0A9CDG3_ARUDO